MSATGANVLPTTLRWKLECSLTLSPFATALAFDSPLLQDVNSASRPREIVEQLGMMKLRYGVVMDAKMSGSEEETFASGRLGLAASEWVETPHKGMRFRR